MYNNLIKIVLLVKVGDTTGTLSIEVDDSPRRELARPLISTSGATAL